MTARTIDNILIAFEGNHLELTGNQDNWAGLNTAIAAAFTDSTQRQVLVSTNDKTGDIKFNGLGLAEGVPITAKSQTSPLSIDTVTSMVTGFLNADQNIPVVAVTSNDNGEGNGYEIIVSDPKLAGF